MTYTVNKSDGNIIAVVNDFQKEIVAGLELAGYGLANYGELTAENFIRLVENFASSTPPVKPTRGQLWYDTSAAIPVLRQYEASKWIGLFSIDAANNRAGIFYNGNPVYPDVNPNPGTLVVRGSDGLVPASSLPPAATSVDSANTANQLRNMRTFGSRNGGLPFNGTQDVALTTSHIAEGDQLFYNDGRARNALTGGRYISINKQTGEIAFNGPDPTSGTSGKDGRGVSGTTINGNGNLIITFTDGTSIDTGHVVGPPGANGTNGTNGVDGKDGTAASVVTSASYGTNGYVVFNGGFCIQWGQYRGSTNRTGSVFTVSYNIAFSQPAWSVTPSMYDPTTKTYNQKKLTVYNNDSNSQFSWHLQDTDSGDTGSYSYGFNWIAVGTVNPNEPSTGTPVPTPQPVEGYTGAPYAAFSFITYGPPNDGTYQEPLTPDKIGTSGNPTWYVWAPGTYDFSNAFSLAKKANSKSPAMFIAVPAGYRLEIFSGPGATGSTTMDVIGPKMIAKPSLQVTNAGPSQWGYGTNWLNWDYSGINSMMAHYTPSTREDQAITSQSVLGNFAGSFRVSQYTGPAPTSSGGSTDTGGGGGGGGGCVWWGSHLQDNSFVYDAHPGSKLWILDENGEGFHDGKVETISFMMQPCYTILTESGIELTASDSTPITLRDGSSINITKCMGHEVPVWDKEGGFRWEEVLTVYSVGQKRVALLNAGNNTFAAGNSPDRYIFTHNLEQNKQLD